MTVSLSSLIGRKVVAVDDASALGTVDHVRVDVAGSRISALSVGSGRKARLVSRDDVRGLAGDVVTVTSASALREPVDDDEKAFGSGANDALRQRVLGTDGYERGTVVDLDFDDDGTLGTVRTSESELPASALRSIGSYAVVVAAG